MTLPIRNGRIRLSQGTLFWREVGYGSTLVFLHGNWQDSSQWLPLMEQLGQAFHCVAPDMLGFGASGSIKQHPYSIELEVTCLSDYLAGLRLSPHLLIADSIGAWIAIRYCVQNPDAVAGLVVLAPEGLDHPTLHHRWRTVRWLASPWASRFWGMTLLTPLIRLAGGDRWLHQIRNTRQRLRRYQATCQLLFRRRQSELRAEWLNEVLPQLTTPVLIVHPDQASKSSKLANTLLHTTAYKTQLLPMPGNEATVWSTAAEAIRTFAKMEWSDTIAP